MPACAPVLERVVDGSTGEFAPSPMGATPRAAGRGLDGLGAAAAEGRSEELRGIREGTLAWLHSWELVTSMDGPGTRMTVFLNGCPLRCQYCHNPDTMATRRGRLVSLDEVAGRLDRYRKVFAATGGGLTISGGEPMMQPAFVQNLLRAAKERGIHTAMDTSGALGRHVNRQIMADLDLVLLDIKAGDEERYREVTGGELAPTLEFGRRLAEDGKEIWVRFVVVPGLTDDEANVARVAAHASSLSTVSRVEVLPFHQMGRDKWDSLGMDYRLADTPPPEPEVVERVREQFRARGLTTY
ncbi:pyruvate formate-lyase-activating protein [Tessaracoccus terricola]